jgi:flagellar assembly protein FliH
LSSIIKANALGHRSLLARGSWHTRGATQTPIRDAAQLLSQARQEAAALLAAAEVESRALRETAHSDGYREGLQAGREQGHKQGVEEGLAAGWESGLAQVRQALEVARDVVSAAEETKSQAFVSMQAEIVELAVAIAEKIVHGEITLNDQYLQRVVSDALEQLRQPGPIVVRVSAGTESTHTDAIGVLQDMAVEMQVIADETLAPGDCVIETEGGLLDGRLSTRLANIRQALRGVE